MMQYSPLPQVVLKRNNVHCSYGGDQPLMFAHGFGCSQSIWHLVAPAFANTYNVILFDYVGAGQSDHNAFNINRYATLHGYAQDLLDICNALDLHNIIFVGHSISSMIGILASIRAPERFQQLILVGPSARYVDDPPDYIGGWSRDDIIGLLDLMERNYDDWAHFLAPMVMQNPERPELAHELTTMLLGGNPVINHHFAKTTFFIDNRPELPLVTVPSLILQPCDDILVPTPATEYLHHHLSGSRVRYLQALGHFPHISNPEELIQLIAEELGTAS